MKIGVWKLLETLASLSHVGSIQIHKLEDNLSGKEVANCYELMELLQGADDVNSLNSRN